MVQDHPDNQFQSPSTKEGEMCQMREEKTKCSGPLSHFVPVTCKALQASQPPNIYHPSTAGWCGEKHKEEWVTVFTFKKLTAGKTWINAIYPTFLFSSQTYSRTVLFCFLTVECIHASACDMWAEMMCATSRYGSFKSLGSIHCSVSLGHANRPHVPMVAAPSAWIPREANLEQSPRQTDMGTSQQEETNLVVYVTESFGVVLLSQLYLA